MKPHITHTIYIKHSAQRNPTVKPFFIKHNIFLSSHENNNKKKSTNKNNSNNVANILLSEIQLCPLCICFFVHNNFKWYLHCCAQFSYFLFCTYIGYL